MSIAIHTNGSAKRSYTLITGGAGFIGTNLAERLLEGGRRLRLLDNLARPGVEENLRWLCERYGDRVEVQLEDVRNPWAVYEAVLGADQVFHFAAQVAVTSSVERPREDFDINARGTLNVLEALRKLSNPPPLLFTSTNKVYGSLEDVQLDLNGTTYRPLNGKYASGIGPDRCLNFESPYGCSKGAADEYVLDYCRMFGLPAVVFRMSCIYGPHQFGTEDQGWIAHFLLRALRDEPITIYGDGRQVRDILFVDDLVRGMVMAMNEIEHVRGRAFNIGGGPERSVSLLQVLDIIEDLHGDLPDVSFTNWRPSDQRFYVSNTTELERVTGWQPEIDVHDGIRRLYEWMVRESPVNLLQSTP
jgi:CDP-paratose 2-epimerase